MTVQVAIEARAVSYRSRVGEVEVRDVSMTIGHGELTAIIGGRGSGKSALLDALSGLLSPSSGAVLRSPEYERRLAVDRITGNQVTGSQNGAAVRRQIGYVPVGETVHPVLPLGRALRYSAELRGAVSPADDSDDDLEHVLRTVNLAGKARVPVGGLNPGERKRAAIAAELLGQPAELFLDDPTASLDPAQAAEVLRVLRRLSDNGMTVVLTTSSPMDADRCDKVALLATGGHLAFFGTPAAARGYFGADSLGEIYERLAGLGDPAAAWSRRFYQFPGTRDAAPVPTTPQAPGSTVLVPDAAGPHSAGRPGPGLRAGGEDDTGDSVIAAVPGEEPLPSATEFSPAGQPAYVRSGGPLPTAGQLFVLVRQNAELVARSWLTRAILIGTPLAVLVSFALLIGAGAFDAPAAGSALIVLGGSGIGLAYGLSHGQEEAGALRTERFAGLSAAAYVLARLAVLLPAVAAADAVALLVPAACSRLPHGYGPSYLTVLLSSMTVLALALLLSVALPGRPVLLRPRAPVTAPAALVAAALLSLLDRPVWWTWLLLAVLATALLVAFSVTIARRDPRPE
jgi:ABC-type multidrug transport system ATPase subunit